jgi:hypothetical protein
VNRKVKSGKYRLIREEEEPADRPVPQSWNLLDPGSRATPRTGHSLLQEIPRIGLKIEELRSSRRSRDQRDQKKHQKQNEEDLGGAGGGYGDTAKAENRCHQGNDQKEERPIQHLGFPPAVFVHTACQPADETWAEKIVRVGKFCKVQASVCPRLCGALARKPSAETPGLGCLPGCAACTEQTDANGSLTQALGFRNFFRAATPDLRL